MTTWRVATFNIRHGLGPDGRVDLARTAQEIAALGADVIGLQEVDDGFGPRSGHADQPSRLAELLGMQVCFGAALDLPPVRDGAPRRRYGLALLTRHEILAHTLHLLPAHPGREPLREPRGVLHARVRSPAGDQLDVLVTHLDNSDPAHRTAQVQGIVRLSQDLTGPALLMGDMNAEPSAPELAALAATGWREAMDAASTSVGEARRSPLRQMLSAALARLRPARGATHPARFPIRRIDSLWIRGPLTVTAMAVGSRGSSDHRPVVATLARSVR